MRKQNVQQLMRKIEALKERVSNLRLQCEKLRAALDSASSGKLTCSECGKQVGHNEKVVFKCGDDERAFCRKCFAEMWK